MGIHSTILAIPHIGTAFGHVIRMSEYISANYDSRYNIFIVIPDNLIAECKRHIPETITIIPRKKKSTVTNKNGILDVLGYLQVIKENDEIFKLINPDYIIGDPGVMASILGTKFNVPWSGIMHGLYLPKHDIRFENLELNEIYNLSWGVANKALDNLITLGTNGRFTSWASIRNTGTIIVPNSKTFEPSNIGNHFDLRGKEIGWGKASPVQFLVTCCSAGNVFPSDSFLTHLAKSFGKITLAGVSQDSFTKLDNIFYLGNNFHYSSLVNEHTCVITHGGHGTLKSLEGSKKVIMIPGDIDQLYNSLLAMHYKNWEIMFDKDWLSILKSSNPFIRRIYWENLAVDEIKYYFESKSKNVLN